MTITLVLALVTSLAGAAEPKAPAAVAAGRFYASAKVVNVLMAAHLRYVKNGVEYGMKSDFRAMYTNYRGHPDLDGAGKELAAAAAALPATPSADAASKALLVLADQELAQAEKTGAEANAMIESAREQIKRNEKGVPREQIAGLPTAWMLIDMLKPGALPIAQARAAAAGKR